MYRLPSIVILVLGVTSIYAQSPHGYAFKVDCASCHNPSGWAIEIDTFHFNHDTTHFPLHGTHAIVDCKSCHTSLVFNEAKTDCASCHTDVHSMSVGNNCARCHNSTNWLVDKIPEIHEENGFPLLGVHSILSCVDCHLSETQLRFDRIGNECINCHRADYDASTEPNHAAAGFSKNCIDCHDILANNWDTESIRHDYFPLTLGHDIQDCSRCHTTGTFTDVSPNCVNCHQTHFDNTVSPDHNALGFSTDCIQCHTIDPDWIPAEFSDHDNLFFPIYSGKHQGEWSACTDCHLNQNNYAEFTCIQCHTNPGTDDEHEGISGYVFQNQACLACHPTGNTENNFDHNSTNFPLTGGHVGVNCLECHADGFVGTSAECVDCHMTDFTASSNPDHNTLGLSTDCASCHTTEPGWMPATLGVHDDFYLLQGAHALIAADCINCHNGDYINTPNTCVGCHQDDFDQTNNPNHSDAQFSTDCASCHDENNWVPSTFDHDGQFFPIYSGAHEGEWSACIDCHTDPNNYSVFTCIGCHTNPDTDDEHVGVNGYIYQDNACLACHPTGDADMTFNHDATNFPLTGAHVGVNCLECHADGFVGTSAECVDCHMTQFAASNNPNHNTLGLSTDCASCHTTEPGWMPAAFDVHDDFYLLQGAHALIAADCINCHNGDYINTPNTCVGCHQDEYNNTSNPDHNDAQFSTDCASCHDENNWMPSTFDHDGQFFPIYSGAHEGEWSACIDCHTDPNNYSVFTCIGCHANPETDDQHLAVNGYIYQDNACLACHPTGDADMTFNHDATNFPLTGAHVGVNCLECHADGFVGTSAECVDCHMTDFTASSNPDHNTLGLSTDCASCHTTEPGWMPATLGVHDDFYLLQGAHALIAADCINCHNGDYINTPNTCVGCHQDDFDQTNNPNHSDAQFSTDCASCHDENNWVPSTFDHDGQFFPIYSGAHEGEWSACIDCHTDPNNYSVFTCIGCHTNPDTDDEHVGVNGYIYQDNACLACHPTGDADMTFNHDATNFPLTGAHVGVNCLECHADGFVGTSAECVDCHMTQFAASNNPNHNTLGLSTDCASCHTTEPGWMPAAFDVHDDFYLLQGAHALIAADCINCHNGDYINTPNTCVGCHQDEYNNTSNPDHNDAQFSTDCVSCHDENNWMPSTFDHDGQFFPIYSGAHEGEWSACIDCHTDPNNYSVFTCIGCHANPETDDQHLAVNGYIYQDNACLACHPTGDADMTFNHDATNFPLTGAHVGVNCLECHADGFVGTSAECVDCHMTQFAASNNPNHNTLGLSTDCASCHTTEPGWMPATFEVHDDFYLLQGAHALIAADCINCHNGDYINTPNTCVGCHQDEYNNTSNPDHNDAQFSTDCASCHDENNWVPSTFDHDGQFFPIYSGAHEGEWSACIDCHTDPNNYSVFTCIGCHTNPDTDDEHVGVNGYIYEDNVCLACHPTGDADMTFNHDATSFPLAGGHVGVSCDECHADGFVGTSTICVDCHMSDYAASSNPNHGQLGLSNDCVSCHTTEPGWMPATFAVHDDFYLLQGAHALIAADCINCHNGDYINTPNTCVGCHQDEYSNTSNPDHNDVQFSTDCASCHSEDGWTPSTFDHDGQFFPIYSGAHEGEWSACIDCHIDPNNYSVFTCTGCHLNPDTDNEHVGVNGYIYEDNACLACHPTGDGSMSFNHDATSFPLAGGHVGVSCDECHADGFVGTSTICVDCHISDYAASSNPNHGQLGLSNDCVSCHTTEPGWMPATFAVHDNYYQLTGAHVAIASECMLCHNGNYNNTPNTCAGCHQDDFNQTTNPNHVQLALSNDCVSCHTTDPGWIPATFAVHDNYYPLTGAHAAIATQCVTCHNGDYNNTPNTCAGCHQSDFNQTTNPNHGQLGLSNDCASCHTTDPGWIPATFSVHDDYYPLTGAHASIASQCAICHNGDYNNTPNTCAGCHQSDFNQTTNPNHGQLGLSNDCVSCHTTDPGWMPATFSVHNNYYVLNGAHALIANDCVLCHNGNYTSTPNTCFGCHQSDYNGTTNPNHSAAQFPTDCESCHSETSWVPSTFNHDGQYFPIYSGKHQGEWNTCVDCHFSASNYMLFSCIGCHEHDDPIEVADDHDGVPGYIYESNACYSCHPNGEE